MKKLVMAMIGCIAIRYAVDTIGTLCYACAWGDLVESENAQAADERVCGDWEPRGLSFHRLLTFLYNQNFTPSCELDGARAEDGLDLRYRFAQTQNVVYQDVQDAFTGIPCSMLEMMVALSIRIEEHILEDAASGNRVGQWFWNMVVSLGLVAMDDTRFNEERAQSVLDRFNAREYQPNGAGGLFTLMHPTEDMRTIDIWYQLMGWLAENET